MGGLFCVSYRNITGASRQFMAVIAIYSAKGGVGKTTIAANLAWHASQEAGRNTLLWDLDAAGGAGFLYNIEPASNRGSKIFSRTQAPEELMWETGYPGLDLLPADASMRQLDTQLTQIGKKRQIARLTEKLGKDYDRIILDCPPGINEVSAQVVRSAEIVIVPLPPSPLSSRAFELVAQEIKRLGKKAPSVLPVFSMVDRRRKLHRKAMEAQPRWPCLSYSTLAEQCAVQHQPLGAFAQSSEPAQQFSALWRAIDRKLSRR